MRRAAARRVAGPALAQKPGQVPRVGILILASIPSVAAIMDGLRSGLRELGYIEGSSVHFDIVSAEGNAERLEELQLFERFEVGTNRGDIHELIHDKILQRSVVNLAPQSSKRKSPKLTIYARWP